MGRFLFIGALAVAGYLILLDRPGSPISRSSGGSVSNYTGASGSAIGGVKRAAGGVLN